MSRQNKKQPRLFKAANIDLNKVSFYVFGYADVWFRDYGPIFVKNPNHELAMLHWNFNSWGEKYEELLKDKQVPDFINQSMALRCFKPGIVLEGGSIDVNGEGTLLTTAQCLLNKNRNPDLDQKQIEKYLADYLGVTHFIWLKCGILGDDTDGHIDDLARFVNPTTIVCAYQEDETDEDYGVSKRKLPNPLPIRRPRWQKTKNRKAAHAQSRQRRRTTAACKLHKLLHRQRKSSGARL